ncbi:MAG: DNRLRE domain-containing protein [Thermoproteota archaeon]|nr:DNRLRE domain-containing protein [Candidatus Brockarchaeota archaeon]
MEMRKKRLCVTIFLTVLMIGFLNTTLIVRSDQEKVEAVFHAAADTYVDQENPEASYGGSEYLKVRSLESKNARTCVFFNLSTIPPGASVLSAKLFLYLSKPPASERTYLCYRFNSAWDEQSLTWNRKPGSSSTFAASSRVSTTPGWVVWDVREQVQKFLNGIGEHAWANFGWEIFDSSEDSQEVQEAFFISSESGEQDKKPYLTIEFTPPKLNITVGAALVAGEWVGLTIKRLSQDGILVTRGDRIFKQDWINIGSITVRLSTSSRTGVFSLSPGGEPVERLVIRDGETQAVVYYRDTTLGNHTLSVSAEGYLPGYYMGSSIQVTVVAGNYSLEIVSVSISPENPVMGDVIKVSAVVSSIGISVGEVALYYSTDGGATWTRLVMGFSGGRYEAYIPGQNAFTEVSYYVEASDQKGNKVKTSISTVSIGLPDWVFLAVAAVVIVAIIGLIGIRRIRKKQ